MSRSMDNSNARRALAHIEAARAARDRLDIRAQRFEAEAALPWVRGPFCAVEPSVLSRATESYADALIELGSPGIAVSAATRAADQVGSDCPVASTVLTTVRLHALALTAQPGEAVVELYEHAISLARAGDGYVLPRVQALGHALAALLREAPTGETRGRVCAVRVELIDTVAQLGSRYPRDRAYAGHWIGISESRYPTKGISIEQSRRAACDALRKSLRLRPITQRTMATRGMAIAELRLVAGDRDAGIAMFVATLERLATALPRHYRSATSTLVGRGLLPA